MHWFNLHFQSNLHKFIIMPGVNAKLLLRDFRYLVGKTLAIRNNLLFFLCILQSYFTRLFFIKFLLELTCRLKSDRNAEFILVFTAVILVGDGSHALLSRWLSALDCFCLLVIFFRDRVFVSLVFGSFFLSGWYFVLQAESWNVAT